MIRLIKRFARDDRGASVIEMALVMPFFATMIIGVADISRAYSAKLRLEQAAYRSIEKVQQYRDTSSTFSTISSEATAAATAATNRLRIESIIVRLLPRELADGHEDRRTPLR